MRRDWTAVALPVLSLGGLCLAWEASFRLAGLDPAVFPPPSRVARAAVRLLVPTPERGSVLLTHILVSLGRLAAALVLGIAGGTAVGLLAGLNRYAYRTLAPLVSALIPVPAYAWVPILLLWLGQGSPTIIVTTALSASLPLAYATMAGVRGVDQRQVWALRTFGAGRLAVVRRVVLPAALASIIAGLRLSFGQAWRTLVGAEFLAAFDAGLGYLIYSARQFLAIDVMFAGLVTLGVFGFLLVYWLVGKLEEWTVVRWGMLARR
jgi:NitT/TauT family transport system permease protein